VYWILLVMSLLVSLVIAVVVGGLATPRQHIASRAIVLKASPDTVWPLIRNVSAYADWRDDIQSVHVDTTDAGVTRWTEVGRSGSISYVAVADEAPSRFTARIADEDLSYSGEWQYVLTASDGGTRVVISEHGEVGNPIFRFVGTHFIGFTRTIDSYLGDLAAQLGETARPEATLT
jgi:hypothetical protein